MEWNQAKSNDKDFLITYYQFQVKKWEDISCGKKVVEHFKKAIKRLKTQ